MELRSDRLRFREMVDQDLDLMAALLGDPKVMRFYPRPKTREEAQEWIRWNQANYRDLGFGLWVLETVDGDFVGDCGLTLQQIEEKREVEVGYHIRADLQNRGFATEAALVAKAVAVDHQVARLIAIINPRNVPSQRVAEKIGLRYERIASHPDGDQKIYAADLTAASAAPQETSA